LVINPVEADLVRTIFARYREEGSVHRLMHWLNDQGYRTKIATSRKGLARGGVPFGRGALLYLLKNRHYLGEIVHKSVSYLGAHPAIIDADLFTAVQAKIAANGRERSARPVQAGKSLFTGILFDAQGKPMSPSFGYAKGGRLYRYYVSGVLQRGAKANQGDDVLRRVSAPILEDLVRQALTRIVLSQDADNMTALRSRLVRVDLRIDGVTLHLMRKALFRHMRSPAQGLGAIEARLQDGEVAMLSQDETLILVDVPARLCVRGGRTRIVRAQKESATLPKVDPALVRGLRQAHALAAEAGVHPKRRSPATQARAPDNPYRRKLAPLAFLAPSIQRAILDGRQPAGLSLHHLLDADLPLVWDDQARLLGF
jgi:hypothetical protein